MPGTVLRVDLVTEANDGNALIYVREVIGSYHFCTEKVSSIFWTNLSESAG